MLALQAVAAAAATRPISPFVLSIPFVSLSLSLFHSLWLRT
jgi:hypothetical protein